MYAFIRGTLFQLNTDSVVIDNNGVGYQIQVPASDLYNMPQVGQELMLYTYFTFSENAGVNLYGFLTEDEKELYLMLTSVSGVGPKAGLAVLSALTPRELKFAILTEDEKSICRASGVGPKMARRIILELKDKLDFSDAEGSDDTAAAQSGAADIPALSDAKSDVILALTSLGYSGTEALAAISKVDNAMDMDTETLLKEALKKLAL